MTAIKKLKIYKEIVYVCKQPNSDLERCEPKPRNGFNRFLENVDRIASCHRR